MTESTIQPLPTDVIHLIAAGEVIDSLAAVVRELAENSIDAGATHITVSVWPTQWRVRVVDDGHGMDPTDLGRAATPHSTSKIRSCSDLWHITSLGFRGEALHSLARLAHLEICSRQGGTTATAGVRVVYSATGDIAQMETVAIAPGTVVTVSNLFGRWPNRRQGLPAPAQQLRQVQLTVQQLALCHPTITWQVEQNNQLWFSLWPGQSAQALLPQILRGVEPADLRTLTVRVSPPSPSGPASVSDTTDTTTGKMHLVVGLPDRCHRRRPDWVRIAVNGRFVSLPELEQAVLSGFQRTLPRHRFPVCLVHLQINATDIDWNRHPAKTEVYLHHLEYWREQVMEAIDQVLRLGPTHMTAEADTARTSQMLRVAEAQGRYTLSDPIQALSSQEKTLSLRVIAQVHHTYILVEHPGGMWLVEQHIAHERVLYEQLCDRWQLVPLEQPLVLTHLSPAQRQQLHSIGITVEPFGDQLWVVRDVPELLAQRSDRAEAIAELSLGGDLQSAQVATACRSAIRNGTPLTLPEMQNLIDQWQRTRNPRTCPHGRPIYLPLEETALARFFRRHWVIGKSHGI